MADLNKEETLSLVSKLLEKLKIFGKYLVWFFVLLMIGWLLGLTAQLAVTLLPGLMLAGVVYYLVDNMGDKGFVETLKEVMKKPFEWIGLVVNPIYSRIKDKVIKSLKDSETS